MVGSGYPTAIRTKKITALIIFIVKKNRNKILVAVFETNIVPVSYLPEVMLKFKPAPTIQFDLSYVSITGTINPDWAKSCEKFLS